MTRSTSRTRRHAGGFVARMLAAPLAALALLAATPQRALAQAGDLVLNVSDSPDPSPVTGDVTYAISVENNGLATSTGVSFAMSVPSGARYRGASGATCSGMTVNATGPGTVTCALPNLAFAAVANFSIILALDTKGVTSVSSTVTAANGDANTADNTVVVQTTVNNGADASLTITPPASTASGSLVSYGITVTNAGPDAATALQVQFPIPSGFTQQGSLPAGCSTASNTITCLVAGPIASGGSLSIGSIPGKITAASSSSIVATFSVALQSGAPGSAARDPNAANNTTVVNTAVTAGSDVRLTVARSVAGPYFTGNTFNFVLTAAYDGDVPSGLTITDVLPSNYTIGSVAAVQNGWSCSVAGQTVTCTRPSGGVAGSNQSLGSITIPVTVNASGNVTNSASISASAPIDPVPSNNTATDGGTTLQDPAADLRITKSGPSPALVVVGQSFSYAIVAGNGGPSAFSGTFVVTDNVPANLTVTAMSGSGWTCPGLPVTGPGVVTCTRSYIGSPLASGANAPTISVTATATAAGLISNVAAVSSPDATTADPNSANNSSTYDVTASLNGDAADLRVVKTVDLASVAAGDVLTYTIQVVNDGAATATNVTMTDVLGTLLNGNTGPANGYVGQTVTLVGAASAVNCSNAGAGGNARTLTCTIPSLPVCTVNVDCPTITVAIRPGGDGGTRTNTASVISSSTADTDLSNNSGSVSSNVVPRADVRLSANGTPNPVPSGQALTYVLAAANDGPSRADNVIVSDTLPLDVVFVSASPSAGSCSVTPTPNSVTTNVNRFVTCNLGSVGNGAQQAVTVVVRPVTAARLSSITTSAGVTTTTTEITPPGATNNGASVTTPVTNPSVDLLVNNVDSVDPLSVSLNTVYTLTATNNGPSDAENVVLRDTLPAGGLRFVSHTVSAGGSCSTVPAANQMGGLLECTFPRLTAGSTATVTMTMLGDTKGVYQNAVAVSSDETDLGFETQPVNNYAAQRTTVRTRADVEVASKVATPGTVAVRRPYAWVLTVRNNTGAGLAEADTVLVTDNLPAGSELTGTPTVNVTAGTASATTCTGTAGATSFSCDLGTLSSGGIVEITVPVRHLTVPTGNTASNTASVTTSSQDVTPSNNSKAGSVSITSSSLAGRVFRDFNNNAAVDAGDTGMTGIGITLSGTAFDGSPVTRSTSTLADGTFSVATLPEGTYQVTRGTVSETFLTVGTQVAGTSGGTATTPPSITGIALGEAIAATDYRFAFVPQARIGVAKTVVGTPVANADGSITAVLRIAARNYSLETLSNVSVTDALQGAAPAFGTYVPGGSSATLSAATYTINTAPVTVGSCAGGTPNAAFDGSAATQVAQVTSLAPSTTCTFDFTLRYRPTVPLPGGNYTNQAAGQGTGALSGQVPSDLSQNGTNADPDSDGNPGNNGTPTPLNAVLAADVGTTVSFPASINAGQVVNGTVTFRNGGPYTANGVGYVLTLSPALGGMTFGNLPAGATATYNAGTGAVAFTGMPATLAANTIASGDGTGGITVSYLQNGVANSTVTAAISTTSNEGQNTLANSASATVTGVPIADVKTELSFTASADAGAPVSGTVGFRNFGPSTATGVTYGLTLSAGLGTVTFGNLPAGSTATYNTGTGVVTFAGMPGTLLSGQFASGDGTSFITVAYTQPGTATSTVTSTIGTATSQGANVQPDNATRTITGQLVADVTTSMAFPASVNAGSPVSGSITYRNNGPSTASTMAYTLQLSPGLTGVTLGNLPAGATASYASGTGVVTLANMPASLASNVIASGNGTTGITLTYTQPGSATSSIASTIATSTNQGANLAPDAASASPGGGLVADVRATVAFPAAVNAGESVSGTVRFGNDGPSPASAVTYALTLSSGLANVTFGNLPTGATATYASGTGVVTFTGMPATLASGEVASGNGTSGITVGYTQNALALTTVAAVITTSTSQGANAAPDNGNATVAGTLIADVTTALAFPGSVPVGQPVTGRVTFRNAGPSAASALTFGMTLATNLAGVSFGNLPAGASATYNSATGAVTFSGMPSTALPNTIISGDATNGVSLTYTQPNALETTIASVIGTGTSQGVNALPDNASVQVSGIQLTDLAVTKVARFTDAAPGDTLTYRIRVTNNGPVALDAGSTLTDENLTGMTLLQVRCTTTASNRCASAPAPAALLATTPLPSLAVGQFYELDVDGIVTAADGGSVSNAARVAVPSGFLDTDNTNDRAAAPAVVVRDAPDLALTKAADSLFVAGRSARYTMTVRNVGRAATSGAITITDPLPAGVSFLSTPTPDWTCSAAGQVVTCATSTPLAVNASTSVSLGVNLAQGTVGQLTNTASVATPRDRVVPNNTASVTSTVLGPPDLAVTKAVDVDTLRLNGSATWTIGVTNAGGSSTTGPVTIVDSLPAGLTPLSASGQNFSCSTVGTIVTCTRSSAMAAGEATSVRISARLSATAPITPLQNTARASTPDDINPANDAGSVTVPVGGQSIATLRKESVGEFVVGEPGRFRMTVRNTGTLPLLGPITITDSLQASLRYRAVEGAGWNCTTSNGVVRCTTPGPIAVGDSASMILVTDVLPAAVPAVTNCAQVDAAGGAIIGAAARSCTTVPVRGDYRLVLELTTPRYDRELGDVPDFYVTVRNVGRSPLPDVRLTNQLPAGFVYAAGTSRRSGAPDRDFGPDGQPRNTAVQALPGRNITPITDPANSTTQAITWPLGDMLPGDVLRIDYRTFIRTGASFNADNITIASAVSDVLNLTVASNVAKTPIRLRRGVFDMRGVIAGKVYAQCDCARSPGQQAGDVGIPGVRVVMEDGTGAITDAEGKYNFVNVRAGLHVVKVDRSTLPAGAALVALVTRNAGDGATRFVDLKAGELHRADFAAALSTQDAMDALLARRRTGDPVMSEGAMLARMLVAPMSITGATGTAAPAVAQRQAPVLGQPSRGTAGAGVAATTAGVAGQGVAMTGVYVPLAMPDVTHDGNSSRAPSVARATAAMTGQPGTAPRDSTMSGLVRFAPAPRPFMAAGLLQGRLDLRSLSRGGVILNAEDDVFEDALRDGAITRDSGQFRAGARGAVLLKGDVKGAGLLTLAFDTERDPNRTQFRDITPDNGFQVFGDGSLREFDAQSQQRLYARLDRGANSLLYGDFATPRSDERRMLLSYDRSMTGLAYHGEGTRGVLNSFGARNSIRQVVDELPSRGLSGPYYLSRTSGVVNSERVEIITRDRNQPSVILARRPMSRFEEYTVEPGTGRVVFRAPVPSLDANLNPMSIRVSYEVDQGGAQFYTYGGDATLRVAKGLEVGAFAVRDENPVDRQTLLGVNATMALGTTSTLVAELGRTETLASTDPGYAWRAELRHRTSRLEGRIFALRTDTAFANRSSTMSGGRTEFGTRWSATVNDRTRVLLDGLLTEDERTSGRRTGASVGIERRLNSALVAEVGYRWSDANGAAVTPLIGQFVTGQDAVLAGGTLSASTTALHFNAARARLSARIPNSVKALVFGEYEQGLDASSATRGVVGGEYLLRNKTRLYAQHEWTSSQQGPYGLAEDRTQQNTVFGIDADWLRNSQTFSEYRARDAFNGRDAEASIGLRNRWTVSRGVALNTSFERVTPLAGNATGAYAATGAMEFTNSELWKGTARMEYRNSPTGDNVFGTLGYARKLSRDWTLLGRTGWDALQGATLRGRSQLGLAWRQTDRNTINSLLRYENHLDQATAAGAPQVRNVADVIAALVNIQPAPWWTVSTRYAAKVARDRVDGVTVNTSAHLLMARSVHDLSRRVDVGVIGSVLGNGSFTERRYGMGGELGLVVMRNLRLAGGYNLFGFSDKDFQSLGYTQRGPYLEFGFKFDETLFGSPRRGQEMRK